MEIVIAAGGMPFGPDTLKHKSLGGSETAVVMMAKELRKKGHLVTVFCQLPEQGQPDFWHNGEEDEDKIRWVHINNYQTYITSTHVDLLIASRDPRLVALPAQAKKKVLWCHDIATHRGLQTAFDQMQWSFDEVWAVSKWYAGQIHKVTGYPKKNIKVVPNGIVPVDIIPAPRSETQIVYAARPERGLENLIKEGGVMEHLPDFDLKVAMYDHFPEEMRPFYEWCFKRIEELPNVELVGNLPQQQMRQLLADSAAYIYPTQFEETSCILARECMSVGTPFLTTTVGALPETLRDCGLFLYSYEEPGTPEWCKEFAEWFKDTVSCEVEMREVRAAMKKRTDLYWDTGAKAALRYSKPAPVKPFSRAWSLVQDGDVVAAYAYLSSLDKLDAPCLTLAGQIEDFYPFLLPEDHENYETLQSYYDRFYAFKKPEINYGIDYGRNSARFENIKKIVAERTVPGDVVIEYGCGEGHISGPLAKDFPDRTFLAFDQVQQNVDMVNKFEEDFGTTNLKAYVVATPEEAGGYLVEIGAADLGICVEVLEHCARPWEVATAVESLVKPGGQVVITTPVGAWEPLTFEVRPEEFQWRNHIWHLDKAAVREMFGKKPDMMMMSMPNGPAKDGRMIGNLLYTFKADHKPIKKLDPLKKALDHHSRQTCAVAAICMNDEDTILKMLHSLDRQVQFVQFAMGPSTDRTRELIEQFFVEHPHMQYKIIDVQKIQPELLVDGKLHQSGFGFDHARNASTEGIMESFDWFFWMDTDEYLSGDIGRYLRSNCLDGYLVPQHHFTVNPRGGNVQVDRPARILKTDRGYRAVGHIHEHFELEKGGPGHCYMLPNIDLGHTGYVNEDVRRDRFNRNFPFLLWDHRENPDRRLGKFLWFRDIIHRMRFYQQDNNQQAVIGLAQEAEQYYNDNWVDMASFGQGTFQSLEYLAESRKVLGIGTEVEVALRLDDRNCAIRGRFKSTKEINRILDQILDCEFQRRESKYY
jgi:glycosyltransferase involved in cell wall biosynthesis/2-polyprenyl-3-methyl-5-hydroxy-6-metoxy-1,4-benzoquinol methylase